MGISKASLKFLFDDFNKRGVRPHGKLLTLSRQYIFITKEDFENLCRYSGWDFKHGNNWQGGGMIDDEFVLSALGFESIDAIDNSEFDGANIIHDLNDTNLPKELENKYDFILEGGTIEHIFNFVGVLENVYRMLKIGGTFIFAQPSFAGINHGYYNFSPSLFFEYFTANHYQINSLIPFAWKGDATIKSDKHIFYTFDPVINDIYDVPFVEDYCNMVFGSVTKTPETTFNTFPNQRSYIQTWEQCASKEQRLLINDTLKSAKEKSIYLYGTGEYLRNMLSTLPFGWKKNVAGLISREPDEIGTFLHGIEIFSLEQIVGKCNIILIAVSDKFQDVVYQRIKHLENDGVRIVKLDT